jgi:hypothetical protein
MASTLCPECSQPMRDDMERCPHCYRPCYYPNVNAARRPEEVAELTKRYNEAVAKASAEGCDTVLKEYEAAVGNSEAVISRLFAELQRLSYSEDEIYATFYQRVEAGLRLPGGDTWDRLRSIADNILFNDPNKRHIRFASLTLNGQGLTHYGDCSLLLREDMISHRASAFEENSVMFMRRHNVNAKGDYEVPCGHRALWSDRSKLAVIKARRLKSLSPATFAKELQRSGGDEKKDVFIEIHIWGSLTIRSIRKVTITGWRGQPPSDAELQVVSEKLSHYNVEFQTPTNP